MPRPHSPDLILTPQDFDDCRWQDALREVDPWSYRPISDAFLKAAEAVEDERQATALRLLTNICFLKFSPDKAAEPYAPCFSSAAGRSFSLDDLVDGDIAFLARAAASMDTDVRGAPLLKARLADIVWLLQSPRNIDFALLAIDSYRAVPLNVDTWLGDGLDCWKRALRLARLCGTATEDRGAGMEASIRAALESATAKDRFLAVELAELMRNNGLGEDQPRTVAQKLKALGLEFDRVRDFWPATRNLREAVHWFKASGDECAAVAMTAARAECWVKRAEDRMSSDDPSHAVAADFLGNAIQIYRTIPHLRRDELNVNERLKTLEALLRDYRRRAIDELTPTKARGIDVSAMVRRAREAVSGQPKLDAVMAFVNLHPWIDPDRLRDRAIKRLRDHPLPAVLFPSRVLSADGRLVAWDPPAMLGDEMTESDKVVIGHRMLDEYEHLVGLFTSACILPALETLRLEHRLREVDFIELARQAVIVPPGRSLLFGKGLFAGYDGDYVAALHVLVPQVEHMARVHLNQAGVETRHRDTSGIETEKGLRFLLGRPESSEILGSDIVFELSALFVEPRGANLRNVVAHGLMNDDEAFRSAYPIYAWWLAMKLMFAFSRRSASTDTDRTPPVEGE